MAFREGQEVKKGDVLAQIDPRPFTIQLFGTDLDQAAIDTARDGLYPDGIAVDDAGNVYVASTKVEVFRPDGSKVGSLTVPQQPANVAFGGADRKTLYITARTAVYQTRVNVPGPP